MRRALLLLLVACAGDASKDASDTDVPADTDTDVDVDADADTDTDVDTDTGTVTSGTVPLAGPCDAGAHLGGFDVRSDALTSVASGAVADGVVPLTIRTLLAEEGDCRLLRQENPFCDPPCAPGETCDFDGTCLPFPSEQDVGTVVVDGLGAPVEMNPSPPGYSYYALGLPQPPYQPGDLVTLTTSGGVHPPLTLFGVGHTPLEPSGEVLRLEEGVDMAVRWDDPGGPVRSTVQLKVNIDQHGTTPVALECEFPDTGEGTVPGGILDLLVGEGVTGIPSAGLVRRTVDSVAVDGGCVDFQVGWASAPEIDVVGFTPCQDQDDCPTGQTCNVALEICE